MGKFVLYTAEEYNVSFPSDLFEIFFFSCDDGRRGDGDVEPRRRKPKIRRCAPPPATRAPYLLRGSNCRGIPSATAQIQPRTAPIREWRSFSPRPGSCVRFAASLCEEPVAPAFPSAVTSLPFRSSKCPHN